VVFCDLPQVPPGPSGKFVIAIMAAVAELEAGLISERTKAALAQTISHDASSRTACAATALLSERSCRMYDTRPAGI
jgi:resolvase-like protein